MMLFSMGIGLERVGIAGPELAMLLVNSAGSGCGAELLCLRMWDSSAKNKKEGGSAGVSPLAALMPKSVPL